MGGVPGERNTPLLSHGEVSQGENPVLEQSSRLTGQQWMEVLFNIK
jgi:hypothetical protein